MPSALAVVAVVFLAGISTVAVGGRGLGRVQPESERPADPPPAPTTMVR